MALVYKVVETLQVEAEVLESLLNEGTAEGWNFFSIQFAVKETTRRPTMAFVLFTRDEEDGS